MIKKLFILMLISTQSTHAAFLNSASFELECAKGKVVGHVRISVFGHNAAVGSTEETIWQEGGLVAFPAAASTMTISSTSDNDDSGGTGVTSVLIEGLDVNYIEISESINPNGQTGTTTSNSYLRINRMVSETSGSLGQNDGIIYIGTGAITLGKPAVVVNLIGVGEGSSQSGFFTVPAAKYASINNTRITLESNNRVLSTRLCGRRDNGTLVCLPSIYTKEQTSSVQTWTSGLIGPKVDIEIRALLSAGNSGASIEIDMILVDESQINVSAAALVI